eukprot:TRINITY_DN6874_c0_g1_i1.p1 TRINITY_DN6874_c0_g1~~TRINITY_DN6874_c0_g1_i1.p1  ORF type:complete len:167 (+),score=26.97 TRINITY_DN6874_c0_g1_i1:48-548(+)
MVFRSVQPLACGPNLKKNWAQPPGQGKQMVKTGVNELQGGTLGNICPGSKRTPAPKYSFSTGFVSQKPAQPKKRQDVVAVRETDFVPQHSPVPLGVIQPYSHVQPSYDEYQQAYSVQQANPYGGGYHPAVRNTQYLIPNPALAAPLSETDFRDGNANHAFNKFAKR